MDTKTLIASRIQKNRKQLWDWHYAHAKQCPPPFYCSIDLRDSGHKIVPVDSNLYPAGFNNICPDDIRAAAPIVRAHFDAFAVHQKINILKKILVIPEAHTSNAYYIENLYYLCDIIKNAGFDVRLGWHGTMPEGSKDNILLKSATEKELNAYPTRIENGILSAGDFIPDMILLNNDFSAGYPKILDTVTQPILPSHTLGWHSRKKSEHFKYYNQLAGEFAKILDIDPWIVQIATEEVNNVNFNADEGIDRVVATAEKVLREMHEAYDRHRVQHSPFAFIKNNHGTYGMGIMVVHSADELKHMNRRTKNKMSVGKGHLAIDSIVVQEGVPTATLVDRLAAEPVIYLVGGELIGGFLRTHKERGTEENLNSPGMVFKKLCMSDLKNHEEDEDEGKESELELVYGSIARISALATGMELAAHSR